MAERYLSPYRIRSLKGERYFVESTEAGPRFGDYTESKAFRLRMDAVATLGSHWSMAGCSVEDANGKITDD